MAIDKKRITFCTVR